MKLHPDVKSQADDLTLDPSRPLMLVDADEVILQFATCLEEFLHENDLYFDMASFALNGNIKRKADDQAIAAEEIGALIGQFFLEKTEHQPAVPGAPEALASLSTRAQIVIVTNVPIPQRGARIKSLKKHAMDYPVVANMGLKGDIIRYLADMVDAPVYFIDDLPHNLTSVAQAAEDVHRIHFIADDRLAKLLGPAEDSHHRADSWPEAHAYLDQHLSAQGF
ncbi:MAG: hypothetical protein ACE363_15990 [Alphaproteobacteria bacterium]